MSLIEPPMKSQAPLSIRVTAAHALLANAQFRKVMLSGLEGFVLYPACEAVKIPCAKTPVRLPKIVQLSTRML